MKQLLTPKNRALANESAVRFGKAMQAIFDKALDDICAKAVRDADSKPFDPSKYTVVWPKR